MAVIRASKVAAMLALVGLLVEPFSLGFAARFALPIGKPSPAFGLLLWLGVSSSLGDGGPDSAE